MTFDEILAAAAIAVIFILFAGTVLGLIDWRD